ncbi:aminopeptidase P family protein [Halorubellus sp. JP-L1]|uniref:M24 family metallopeptidase n=1 Tax=Halorubellus sp. JP-L1 TaxID=2715753 RepID=UPI00140A8325|nr:Xaa-Pro peptidase family protein [Halorubellus sp. JP-L1]NHN40843.1 aminopeptidase P family protein [Halorubellus sp. JP-L1]
MSEHFDEAVFRERTGRVQAAMSDADADLAVLFPSSNLHYLAGFEEDPAERHLFLFVPREGDPAFVVPTLYETQVRAESWVETVRAYGDDEDPLSVVEDVLDDLLWGVDEVPRVLVDDSMWATFTQDLRGVLPDANWGLASEAVADVRVRKDDAELDALRRAGRVADDVSEWLRSRGEDVVGSTETELADEIEEELRARGASDVAFPVILGSGPNGAMPHHTHGDREIGRGDPVVLDFGGTVDDYPGDQTRTVVFAGDPPERFREVHDVVREAQQAAVDAVEPGVEAQAVDAAAREVIEAAGYGDAFFHRTGHGVGLDVHESPYIVAGNDRVLEPGMVFSIEPGIYLDGEFGVRIEDLVAVTDDGCERLNDSPRDWRCG